MADPRDRLERLEVAEGARRRAPEVPLLVPHPIRVSVHEVCAHRVQTGRDASGPADRIGERRAELRIGEQQCCRRANRQATRSATRERPRKRPATGAHLRPERVEPLREPASGGGREQRERVGPGRGSEPEAELEPLRAQDPWIDPAEVGEPHGLAGSVALEPAREPVQVLSPVEIRVEQVSVSVLRATGERVEVRELVRVDAGHTHEVPRERDRDDPGQARPGERGAPEPCDPEEQEGKRRQHVAQPEVDFGEEAHGADHDHRRHQQHEFRRRVGTEAGARECRQHRSPEQHPGSERDLERERDQVVVTPGTLAPFSHQIRRVVSFRVASRRVDSEHEVLGERNPDRAERARVEAVPQLGGGPRSGREACADEGERIEPPPRPLAAVAEVHDRDRSHARSEPVAQSREQAQARVPAPADEPEDAEAERHEAEDRQQQDRHELREQRQPERRAGRQRTPRRRRPQVAPERVARDHETCADAEIHRHQAGVRDQVGRQTPCGDGNQPGPGAEGLACPPEQERPRQDRDGDPHAPRPEVDPLVAGRVRVHEVEAELEVRPLAPKAGGQDRLLRERRERGEELHERRVVVVEFEGAGAPVDDPGREVRHLVHGDGRTRGRVDREPGVECQQQRGQEACHGSAAAGRARGPRRSRFVPDLHRQPSIRRRRGESEARLGTDAWLLARGATSAPDLASSEPGRFGGVHREFTLRPRRMSGQGGYDGSHLGPLRRDSLDARTIRGQGRQQLAGLPSRPRPVASVKTILTLFGTRPEVIKLAPVIWALERRSERWRSVQVSSSQHSDLLRPFARDLGVRIDHDLAVMTPGQAPSGVLARVVSGLEPVFTAERPDLVLVQGDTTTAIAGALAAFYAHIPVGHVEAGLRTGDRNSPFPEEMNRRLITTLADFHFAATARNVETLRGEGVAAERIVHTGNPVVDALQRIVATSTPSRALSSLLDGLAGQRVIALTTHRRENFGEVMASHLGALRRFVERHPETALVFPVHPNPAVRAVAQAELGGAERIHCIDPLEYADFAHLLARCWLVASDSGGVQEEAPSLGKPVLILRDTTERPEVLECGVGRLVGHSGARLEEMLERALVDEAWFETVRSARSPFGDGNSGERIAEAIESFLALKEAVE